MDEDTIPDHISPHYTSVPLHVLRMCQELSEISMIDAFGKKPFPWQKAIITHLNLMTCPTSGIPPSPTFLCAPTGGGKSIARDSFAAGQGHVSWCISPLLSLGADQVIKINQIRLAAMVLLSPSTLTIIATVLNNKLLPNVLAR
jgi:superfamily II DNA helicase RecQ